MMHSIGVGGASRKRSRFNAQASASNARPTRVTFVDLSRDEAIDLTREDTQHTLKTVVDLTDDSDENEWRLWRTPWVRTVSDIALAVCACKRLEYVLATRFGAPGDHPKKCLQRRICDARTPSGKRLPGALIGRLMSLASIRNNLVHDCSYNSIPNRAGYVASFDAAFAELRALAQM